MSDKMQVDRVESAYDEQAVEDDGDNGSDSSDASESDASDGADGVDAEARIGELRTHLAHNATAYDLHIEYISLLRKAGRLDVLRHAREKMSAVFPLTEELWLQWIKDEILNARGAEGYAAIVNLAERAIKDYLSISTWLLYAEFLCTAMEDRMSDAATAAGVRAVFERAIAAGGLHVTEGVRLWSAYRAFDEAELHRAADESDKAKLVSSLDALYRRQLSVPLINMEETMASYETWRRAMGLPDVTPEFTKRVTATVAKVDERLPFEEAVSVASPPPLEAFLAYIAFEKEKGDPSRVQIVFERAVKDHPLDLSLWLAYVTYMESTVKSAPAVTGLCERAVRNCPWASIFWIALLRCKEKMGSPREEVDDAFERALGTPFAAGQEYLDLWLAVLDFHRRQIDWALPAEQRAERGTTLRRMFSRAVGHLEQHFGTAVDPFARVQRYWARTEARLFKDASAARKVWDALLKDPLRVHTSWLWAEYAQLEMECMGSVDGARKVFKQALTHLLTDAGIVYEAFLDLERLHGNLDTFDDARRRIEGNAARDTQHREAEERHQQQTEAEKPKRDQRAAKPTQRGSKPDDGRSGAQDGRPDRKRGADDAEDKPAKRRKGEEEEPEAKERRDAHTIFVSNLDKQVDEVALQSHFTEKVGVVVEVRLVKNLAGFSKCFAYVEFAIEGSVDKAISMDRQPLLGRPMLISRAMDKDKRAQKGAAAGAPKGLKFSEGADPRTLFVANLPFAATSEDLKRLFEKFGAIKEVRVVEKAGKPKGYAYVEFVDAEAAASAVAMDKQVFMERPLSVAISNPGARPPNPNPHLAPNQPIITRDGERPKARIGGVDLARLVPRAVRTGPALAARPKVAAPKSEEAREVATGDLVASDTPAEAAPAPLSNSDFRKFLRK